MRIRTADLRIANALLYQLSYRPYKFVLFGFYNILLGLLLSTKTAIGPRNF